MEFFRYKQFLEAVGELGTAAREESDEIVRFEIKGDDPWAIEIGGDAGERTLSIGCTPDQLPQRVDDVLHASGVAEAAIIPVGPWRKVLDLAAFELATDERWQDIDAEAALHMNGRDPLALLPEQYQIVQIMVRSIVENGDSPDEALTVVASDAPLVIEARPDGTATVRCEHEAIAREIVKKLS